MRQNNFYENDLKEVKDDDIKLYCAILNSCIGGLIKYKKKYFIEDKVSLEADKNKIFNILKYRISNDASIRCVVSTKRYVTDDNLSYENIILSFFRGLNRPYRVDSMAYSVNNVYVIQDGGIRNSTDNELREMLIDSYIQNHEEFESSVQGLTFKYTRFKAQLNNFQFSEGNRRLLTIDGKFNNFALYLSEQSPYYIRVNAYSGEDVSSDIIDKQVFTGSVFEQYDKMLEYLLLNNKLLINSDDIRLTQIREYDEKAIEIALLNLVIHRAYMQDNGANINIFSNRIEFLNHGSALFGNDSLSGLVSNRNKKLANIFKEYKYTNGDGQSIRELFALYRGFKKPSITLGETFFKLELFSKNQKLFVPIKEFLEYRIIELLKRVSEMSRSEIQVKLNLKLSTLRNELFRLEQEGKIARKGQGRSTKYYINN